ncbi:class I SAM-dependent methyltransferase [Shewanella surugensis]|uniref:Methyltransferase domain-containing protein n=1 Tax=Shewanella surugensis TaxID=212020 RepID=A0ABT0LCC1_9GAMM|nr:class I SAM-dependent methyltransferase [Shewanella surugensis]MCL1125324.1 methyltransferase domain-containing protein [Shewanella surugensis]
MEPQDDPAYAGQAVYTRKMLLIYNLWVLGFSNACLWRCPTAFLRAEFHKKVSLNHLDVGVGTGYYLEKCLTHTARRVGLLDVNPVSLSTAAAKIRAFHPEIYKGNVLAPLSLDCDKFDSISMNYLLHCLPGNIVTKSVVFWHLNEYLKEGGVLFGSTILGQGTYPGFFATKLMNFYNSKGIFDNLSDDLTSLETVLNETFTQVKVEMRGCVAIFSAVKK